MPDKEIKKKKPFNKTRITDNNGLKVSYDKIELDEYLPHLMSEVSESKKSLKIDSVKFKIEQEFEETIDNSNNYYPEELYNPKAIDFIRRCTKDEEAIEILDYLLRRKELTKEEYTLFKSQILQKDGLKKLIEECGGFKESGYYERKYRNFTQQRNSEKERITGGSKTKKK
ncbi:MAG: DUF2095 family protein [Candidatus Hodarchaeota archaeon]